MEIPQLEAIQSVLKKILGANTAYGYVCQSNFNVFGQHSINGQMRHLGLLVFSDAGTAALPERISREICALFDDKMTVVVLLHKMKSLKIKSQDQRWFFDQIIRFGYRITLDAKNPPYLNETGFPKRDPASARKYWEKCDAVANHYLESATASGRLDVELVKVAMLTTSMEFTALGLIRIFIGYTPNRQGLKFLFAICNVFTDLTQTVFEPDSERGQRCLKTLLAPPTMLRHWDELGWSESDYVFLESACAKFLAEATRIASDELNRLETQLNQ